MNKDLMQYMKIVGDSVVFTGDTLEVFIPNRYQDINLCTVGTSIETIAVFEVVVDRKHRFGLLLPTIIEMDFNFTKKETVDGILYLVAILNKGNKFIRNRTLLKRSVLAYSMFKEFIHLGNMPKWLSYNDSAKLFDNIHKICDFRPPSSHTVFELLNAHLYRDKKDLSKKYRFTNFNGPMEFLGLSNIEFGTDSTTSKVVGAYFTNGMNTALTNRSEQRYELEDLLRE